MYYIEKSFSSFLRSNLTFAGQKLHPNNETAKKKAAKKLSKAEKVNKSRFSPSLFGEFYSCFGEKVLLLKQKIFLQAGTETFLRINKAMTIIH